jgi:hypothetical protein
MVRLRIRHGLALAALVGALTATACYDSDTPIDATPQTETAPALFGAWRCLPLGGKVTDKPATMTIAHLGQRAYSVVFDDDRYEGYTSAVKRKTIANLKIVGSGEAKPWSLVRYEFLRRDVLQLQVLRDKALPEAIPPSGLRKVVESLGDSVYVDFAVCVRASEVEESRPTG